MRETVIDRWVAILTMIFALPLTVQANTTGTADSRILESRYLTVQVGPEVAKTDLLKSIVDLRVPEKITTVGGALDFLLRPYGFQLDDSHEVDEQPEADEQYLLLVLTLPEPHRNLESMTLMDALTTLGGKSFLPLINPVKRSVRYQLREGFDQFATAEDMEVAKQEWLDQKEMNLLPPRDLEPISAAQQEHQTYGPVQRGDSLSHIASQLNLTGMTIDQVLVYLFRANPHAFANGNMNHLLAGKVLKIPPVHPETLPTAFEASQLVDEHYRLWKKRLWIQREVTP
ncbi:FimV/HubP family polar landmark protein [Cycloclasticus sp. PY97N]|jgi:FimV-like protein|uniref:FimV/HubP family polar landmark protein n=1 Tax=Cycloclasticus sp. PY97N TaxID=728003 RepID=UPI0013B414F6|nr:FimV/HubP family polar landmark protein [Cycloclasticus sp. PY97N]